jgi:hypothetical protein
MMVAGFRVKAEPVAALLEGLQPVRSLRGHALLLLTASRHRKHSFGEFDEATISVLVRQPDAPPVKLFRPWWVDLFSGQLAVASLWHGASTEEAAQRLREQWQMEIAPATLSFYRRANSRVVEVNVPGGQLFTLSVMSGRQFSLGRQKLCMLNRSSSGFSRARWAGGWHDACLSLRGTQLTLGGHPMAKRLLALGIDAPRTWTHVFGACIDALDGMMGVAEHLPGTV